ncbi:MAG: Autoinducer 2 sensor kinase/phosphatase LuxQ [Pseudomonadota bacterium]
MQITDHFLRGLRHVQKRWPLQLTAGALIGVSIWVVIYTYESSERALYQYATESAQEHAESVTQFRNFYAQELVPRAIEAGVEVTHDYKSRRNALPLPATLTIELGHYMAQVDGGTQVRLYSDMPFPWRVDERRLDDFQTQALAHLKRNPEQPFVREEMLNGQRVMRYAQADRMLTGCVACHNRYQGSPKTNWQIGDVRGALEVILPVSQWQSATTDVLTRTFTVLLAVVLWGLLMVWLSVRRIRGALIVARDLSAQRQQAIGQLHQEISERQLIEQELRLSESKLQSIFTAVPEAIVVADARGRIVQCNVATAEIFGFKLEELIGQNIKILMQPNERAVHDGHLDAYAQTGQKNLMNQPRVLQGMRKDGTLFPVRITVKETRVDDAHFFIGVIQDFTAIQRTQDLLVEAKNKAEQANRMRGEFLANMSHEIRTPMNGILGMTELAMTTDDRLAHKEYLSLARDSASHLLHIINQILDFSKIEAGALELEELTVCPAQLVRHTARSLDQLAQAKGVMLKVENDPNLPELVWMDPVRVRQVLTNLIGNAIKFTEDGAVTVKTQLLPNQTSNIARMELSVVDTGIGFDVARTEALFSPFTQADGSITRSFGGTGLGLAITRSLVQLMGGDIRAKSERGSGSCFTITLPLRIVAEAAIEVAAAGVPSADIEITHTRPLAVLLVEDHEINLKLAQIMLQRMGHTFVVANDGQQALDCLGKEHFDLVLLDVMMPVMDGLTALRIWRERETEQKLPRTTVLMVTAHAMTGDRERFMAAGADGYVSKPMSEAALRNEINRALVRSR